MRVLVIEDSPTNMLLSVGVLEAAGHSVLQATRAETGIALARAEHPDVVLLDIQLPDLDGMAATRLLKADPATRDIPVLALTACAMKGDRDRFLEAGCDGYIEKPIRYKAFLAEVEISTRGKTFAQRPAGQTGGDP